METVELEKTFLAKYLPKDLASFPHKELIDVYIPKNRNHPTMRVRKNGDRYEVTKKVPVMKGDFSQQTEHTIVLDEQEFQALENIDGKRLRKIRYQYPYQGMIAEIDIFQDELAGLVVIDIEFKTNDAKDAFTMPDFCLADVTQEEFLAGGMLCGKSYEDIAEALAKYQYRKLEIV